MPKISSFNSEREFLKIIYALRDVTPRPGKLAMLSLSIMTYFWRFLGFRISTL